jgi:ADP-ribose pyrophosphatase
MMEVARRELAEEAGVCAKRWERLSAVDVCNGIADDVQTLFWATELSATNQNLDPEEDITVAWTPLDEAVRMVMDGRITEVCSVAGILMVALLRNSRK